MYISIEDIYKVDGHISLPPTRKERESDGLQQPRKKGGLIMISTQARLEVLSA